MHPPPDSPEKTTSATRSTRGQVARQRKQNQCPREPATRTHASSRALMRRPPTLYKWMAERPRRFYIAVRTACVRRRIRSSAPRELLAPATERQSRAEPPHRSGGILGPAPLPRLRGGRWTTSSLGDHVQLSPLLPGPSGPHSGRKTGRASPATAGSVGISCLPALAT